MTSRKKVGFIAGAGVGAAAAAALRRRWSRTEEVTPDADEPLVSPELGDVAERFLTNLSAVIRIPTISTPEGFRPELFDELHDLLRHAYPLTHERLEMERIGGHTMLFTWRGADSGLKPFLLMAHQDVVPVEAGSEGDWEHPPFSGARTASHLWGRGSLDDKGSMIGIFEAVESLLRDGFEPAPTVFLLFGHDEEEGGARGAALAAELLGERGVRLRFALDEGGAVVSGALPGVEQPFAMVGIGEKSSLDVEIVATGEGGHSSLPPAHTAVGRVAAAVKAVEDNPMPARLAAQRPLLDALAGSLKGPRAMLLRNRDWTAGLVERVLARSDLTNALIRTTSAATVIKGGVKSNLLPQEATAVVNFRILPGDTRAGVLDHVRSVVGDGVRVQSTSFGSSGDPPPVSSTDSPAFGMLVDVIERIFPDAVVAPWVIAGATDSRYFVTLADDVYRFAPFTLSGADLDRVHGTGERIATSDAAGVVEFYRSVISTAGSGG
jgi:carboxypeptidase PM20D1